MASVFDGWVLTHEWWDGPAGVVVSLWLWTEAGPVHARLEGQEAVVFVERTAHARRGRRRQLELTTLEGRPVDALYFRSRRELLDERDRLVASGERAYESDVKPDARFLMERFVTGAATVRGDALERDGHVELIDPEVRTADVSPRLALAAFDIETDGPHGELLSIAATDGTDARVWVIADDADRTGTFEAARDEPALISAFEAWVRERDPDVVAGWNSIEFDLAVLCRRAEAHGRPLRLGRGGETARVLLPDRPNGVAIPRVPGRVFMDGIATLRTFTFRFESFSLDDVAQAILGEGKLLHDDEDRIGEIRRMFREDKPALAAYNRRDAELARRIFVEARLVELAVARQRLTGLTMDRQGGAVAAFDYLYLPRLHRHGHVAPDTEAREIDPALAAPGGWVMEPDPGLHDNVLVLDFKSLYPSIIRTFRIDPMGMAFPGDDPVEGFGGARFHRHEHVLPELIETLWAAREDATKTQKRELSTAIKILMNSFYGVLGTPACRFFETRLASSITRRGHEIIRGSREHIEERGLRVIYGDTDSLFVLLGAGRDEAACDALGEDARVGPDRVVEGALAPRAPTRERARGALRGALPEAARPHHAGLRAREQETLRGLGARSRRRATRGREGSRSRPDRLDAARAPFSTRALPPRLRRRGMGSVDTRGRATACAPASSTTSSSIESGCGVTSMRTRRTSRRTSRPRASSPAPCASCEYVMTTRGPEPIERQESPIDHDHYFEKQLAPAADAILSALGTTLAALAGKQMSLF